MPAEGLLCGRLDVQGKAEREGGRQRKKGGQRITLLRTRKDKGVSVAIDMGIRGHLVFFSLFVQFCRLCIVSDFSLIQKKLLMG